MVKCSKCSQSVRNQPYLSCENCRNSFHISCANMNKEDFDFLQENAKKWCCALCEKEKRKSLQFEAVLEKEDPTNAQIVKMIIDLRKEIRSDIKNMENSLGSSIESAHEKFDELKKTLQEQGAKLDSYTATIAELVNENKFLKKQMQLLQVRLDDAEQYSRANTVEIHGLPVTPNENVTSLVQQVGKSLGVEFNESNIDACHRLGNAKQGAPTPGIVVRFVQRNIKEELLRKRKVKRDFSTVHIGLSVAMPIYINESLCPGRRKVFAMARAAKLEKGYKYLWIRNGNILIRKDDGTAVVKLNSLEDVSNLK